MKHCILAIIAALSVFGCNNEVTSSNITMQKPARCKTLLRFSFETGIRSKYDVAECINTEGNKAVFIKPTGSSKWDERVMLEGLEK